MEKPRYLTSDGRILHRAETNLHHIQWRSDWYRSTQEKKYRNASGMVIRLAIGAHNDLHGNVQPPQKPNPNLMRDMHCAVRNMDYSDPYDHFTQIAMWLGEVAETSTCEQNAHEAGLMFENYVEQSAYIEQGRLEIIR